MDKWLQILIGLVLIIAMVYSWGMNPWNLGTAALIVLKGGLMWIVFLIGLIMIILGISELKED